MPVDPPAEPPPTPCAIEPPTLELLGPVTLAPPDPEVVAAVAPIGSPPFEERPPHEISAAAKANVDIQRSSRRVMDDLDA